MKRTLKLRIRGNTKWLDKLAVEANFVWNYLNGLSYYMIRNRGTFLSAYDMHPYLTGGTKEGLKILNHTVQEIAEQYCVKRRSSHRRRLSWRKSSGPKRSLGWVPFKASNIRLRQGFLKYNRNRFKVWDSYGLENYKFRAGSFNQDSQGRWYINIVVETEDLPSQGQNEVGIDLGLKDLATLSNGEKLENKQFYRNLEPKLKTAQRANKIKQVSKINKKIKNRRKDYLHKLSTRLIKENKFIAVGNVNSSKLAKTNMAKSVGDASWYEFRTMLEYKAIRRQVKFVVVNEAYTSVTCSVCNNRTGPQGLEGLRMREWECSNCKSVHDRDINAAKNILRLGHQSLVEGVPDSGEDVKS